MLFVYGFGAGLLTGGAVAFYFYQKIKASMAAAQSVAAGVGKAL